MISGGEKKHFSIYLPLPRHYSLCSTCVRASYSLAGFNLTALYSVLRFEELCERSPWPLTSPSSNLPAIREKYSQHKVMLHQETLLLLHRISLSS